MKKLIVNADDFGRHISVNRAIIQGYETGCITSASLMPGGEAFDDAVAKAAAHPDLGIGVHLTLIGEKPVLDPAKIPSLVDEKGRLFQEYPQFLPRFLRSQIKLEDVRKELTAQMEKIAASGLPITHIDSHQHLHVLPGVIDIVLDLAEQHNITALRTPVVPLSFTGGYPQQFGQFIKRAGLVFLARLARAKARKRGFRIPDHFFGIVAGGSLREACMVDIVRNLPDGVSEVMVHPGDDDQVLGTECGWSHPFEEELEAVLSAQVLTLIREKGIQLVSFKEVK